MSVLSPQLQSLIEQLQILPGVGPKSAQRMAFKLLKPAMRSKALSLGQHLTQAMQSIKSCPNCQNYCEDDLCPLCANPARNHRQICVVQSPMDILVLESSGAYQGLYFVLLGQLSPIDGIGPKELGLDKLAAKLHQGEVDELILATATTLEGEATAHYLARMAQQAKIQVSRLATGIPLGGELEFLDAQTLSQALKTRQILQES